MDENLVEKGINHIRLLERIKNESFEAGNHYCTIDSKYGSKPRLNKPGAELLCKIFDLRPSCEQTITKNDESSFEVLSICTILDANGVVVAKAHGYAQNRESLKDIKNAGTIKNTAIKMADIRAMIAATLIATGASALFTQDVGDEKGFAQGIAIVEPLDGDRMRVKNRALFIGFKESHISMYFSNLNACDSETIQSEIQTLLKANDIKFHELFSQKAKRRVA